MSFPSLFALLFARSHLPRRRTCGQWLPALAFALAALLGSAPLQAATFAFDGRTIGGCNLAAKEYNCPTTSLNGNDTIYIAGGYTLKINGNFSFGFNQGLVMVDTSRFITTGWLSVADMKPANLDVLGGTIEAGGTFYMGNLTQTISADVKAGGVQLGPSIVTVNGSVASAGLVTISYGSRIYGDVSGTVVNAGPSVTIGGTVTASSRFTLGSSGTVTGDVTAPTTELLAASARVNGNITASARLTLGSSARVGGNVDTGQLLLQSSSATISGNASVDHATLEWAGRVLGRITCKNGTAKDKCDCVTNNSGYALNSTNGPRCDSPLPKGPHHFRITHDGVGDTCVPEQITVLACANATCTAPHYTAGVSGTLGPFGTAFSIPVNASTAVVSATRIPSGAVTLAIPSANPASLWADTCTNTAKNTNSCAMEFLGGAKLILGVPHHLSGESATLTLRAVKANDTQSACVTAFSNVSVNLPYRCTYGKPATGSRALTLNGTALSCNGAPAGITTDFDANGEDRLTLVYPDAGEVELSATADSGKGLSAAGSTRFIVAPKSFELVKPAAPIRAGAAFALTVRARNAAGEITPNFDTARLDSASGTSHTVALDIDCRGQAGADGVLTTPAFAFSNGVATARPAWSEAGKIDLKASVVNFLGSDLDPGGSTNLAATGCPGNVGPFIPAYFKVAQPSGRKSYYSGEPLGLEVSAMNAGGTVTANYSSALALSEPFTLVANDKDGAAFGAPAPGTLGLGAATTPLTIPATAFEGGIARINPFYTLATYPAAPAQIRLRAANVHTRTPAAAWDIGSALPATAEEAKPFIRSGRLRLGSRVGGLKTSLSIPLMAEYWTGRSWLLNDEDDFTVLPPGAFAVTPNVAGMTVSKTFPAAPYKLVKGAAALTLQVSAGGPGWADIAVNLNAATVNRDTSCVVAAASKPATSGAAAPWLQPLNTACHASNRTDPAGRATFGVASPEQRRLIHVREVFN